MHSSIRILLFIYSLLFTFYWLGEPWLLLPKNEGTAAGWKWSWRQSSWADKNHADAASTKLAKIFTRPYLFISFVGGGGGECVEGG